YDRAVRAMRNWHHFAVQSIGLYPTCPSLEIGTNLIVYAQHFPLLWSVNTCRIVYLIDDRSQNLQRFGYGYGTLPYHAEKGEERFLIEWDLRTDDVSYKISAFSKANQWLVALLSPVAIRIQDSFRFASLQAMHSAVTTSLKT